MIIKPTVGRVVWLWNANQGRNLNPVQPYSATIAYVYDDHMINVSYVDHRGEQYHAEHIKLEQDDKSCMPDPKPGGPYCTWMPYQVGQARQQIGEARTGPVSADTAR